MLFDTDAYISVPFLSMASSKSAGAASAHEAGRLE